MTNPFAHDTTSNAAGDYNFSEDDGVPAQHMTGFAQAAMSAPNDSLGETDYRVPPSSNQPSQTVTPRPGSYPQAYAP
jgi:hypothetical protein